MTTNNLEEIEEWQKILYGTDKVGEPSLQSGISEDESSSNIFMKPIKYCQNNPDVCVGIAVEIGVELGITVAAALVPIAGQFVAATRIANFGRKITMRIIANKAIRKWANRTCKNYQNNYSKRYF